MTRGMSGESRGVGFRLAWKPDEEANEMSEWRFVLRASNGAEVYLRGDAKTLGLYRTGFAGDQSEVPIASETLPSGAGVTRAFALIPGEKHLHVFVDGAIAFSIQFKDAHIPKQLAFVVKRGTASIRSVRVLGGGFVNEKNQ